MSPSPGIAVPVSRYPDRSRLYATAWALLAVASAAVLTIPRFLPFYDYSEWLLQAQIVHDLWLRTTDGMSVSDLYTLVPAPVPNLAAPVGIALLTFVLPIELAGRVFLVVGVLGFGVGYAFLVRQLQGRVTALEFSGLIWAFGYFLQRGYISYLFALPIAFVGIGLVHRLVARPDRPGRLLALPALQVSAYLAHLVSWVVLAATLGVYAVRCYRGGERRAAVRLGVTTTPAVALLSWYTLTSREIGHIVLYTGMRDKFLSMVESGALFLRMDPFPGVVPIFSTQVVAVVCLAIVVGGNVRLGGLRSAWRTPALRSAALLAICAVVNPISNVNSLTKPDQRLLFPALLLGLAALPWRPARVRNTTIVLGVVVATLVAHAVTWVSLDVPLTRVADALSAVPGGTSVTTIAIPGDGGCQPRFGPSIGIPSLKWFDVVRKLRLHDVRAELQETSIVRIRFDPRVEPGLRALTMSAADSVANLGVGATEYAEVFGCAADLAAVGRGVASRYRAEASGDGYLVLRRIDDLAAVDGAG
jgi:hypothetical protein